MKVIDALKITGSLSKPSKMPGWAYGLPVSYTHLTLPTKLEV